MYIEFEDSKLVNTNFFGRVIKKDETRDGVVVYCVIYELLSGEVLTQEFDNEAERNAAYNQLLS